MTSCIGDPRRACITVALLLVAGAVVQDAAPRSARAGTASVDVQALDAILLTDVGDEMNPPDDVTLPGIDQDVYFSVTYQLNGSASPVEVEAQAMIDGQPYCSGAIELQPDGVFLIYCPDPWQATAGTHTLHWELDSTNALAETDETNNVAEVTFAVADVDLVAERAYLRTAPDGGDEVSAPTVGQSLFFHVDYQLSGIDMPVRANIRASIDDEPWCGDFVEFEPGADGVVYCLGDGWVATPGNHTLRWEIDDLDLVTETDETNNVVEFNFTVAGGAELDLVAVRAFLVADSADGSEITNPAPGQQVFPYLEYETPGTDVPVTADVRAFLDDELQCSGSLDLGPEPATVLCPGGWTATEGIHTLRWVIDEANAVAEVDEMNNVATLRFRVGTAPECTGDCNGSGIVDAAELVRGIWIMLGYYELDQCPTLDADVSGDVTIDEAVMAIDDARNGCGTL